MPHFSPAWPHGDLQEVFPDIFFVMGTNITHYDGVDLQFSRNMIIVRSEGELTLINTVRLDDNGLKALDALGKVTNIVRIGAFHGRDDAFYLDRYRAKLWALKGIKVEKIDVELTQEGPLPFPGCSVFIFETSKEPEGILYIRKEGGILIACDSIKNWTVIDPYFSPETGKIFQEQGLIKSADISHVWKEATQVQAEDFVRLKTFSFRHLLSAHGEPILNEAYEKLTQAIEREFGV
jgi:hypothetical protein